MKNLISLVAILLCFATSYGQETKPTKQETMDWIAGKLIGNLNGVQLTTSYQSNGIIRYNDKETKYVINLNKLASVDYCKINDTINVTSVHLNGANIFSQTFMTNKGTVETFFGNNVSICPVSAVCRQGLTGWNCCDICSDQSLVKRFQTALTNLINYNTSKTIEEKY